MHGTHKHSYVYIYCINIQMIGVIWKFDKVIKFRTRLSLQSFNFHVGHLIWDITFEMCSGYLLSDRTRSSLPLLSILCYPSSAYELNTCPYKAHRSIASIQLILNWTLLLLFSLWRALTACQQTQFIRRKTQCSGLCCVESDSSLCSTHMPYILVMQTHVICCKIFVQTSSLLHRHNLVLLYH